jgi:hypothetical protein
MSNGIVACSSSANVPYTCLLHPLLSGRLTLELFIEGEHCSLARLVNVSCSATPAGEPGGRLGESGLAEGGRAACRGTAAGLGGFEGVSSAATSRVNVFAWVWVRLGD